MRIVNNLMSLKTCDIINEATTLCSGQTDDLVEVCVQSSMLEY